MIQDSIPNIGLLLIATNKYLQFIQPLLESADKFFFKNCNVHYYIFTNQKTYFLQSKRNISYFDIEHEPWPNMTLKRYDFFSAKEDILNNYYYLYYCDADMKFFNYVDQEIL